MKNTLVEFLALICEKKLDNGPGPFSPLMKYSYGEDEWKMLRYNTTYSTDEKQLYISDVNSYYFTPFCFSLLSPFGKVK